MSARATCRGSSPQNSPISCCGRQRSCEARSRKAEVSLRAPKVAVVAGRTPSGRFDGGARSGGARSECRLRLQRLSVRAARYRGISALRLRTSQLRGALATKIANLAFDIRLNRSLYNLLKYKHKYDHPDSVGSHCNHLGNTNGTPTSPDCSALPRTERNCSAWKGYFRTHERRIELRPESTNPEHKPIAVDLKRESFEVCGVAVGALTGNRFNGPDYETWTA